MGVVFALTTSVHKFFILTATVVVFAYLTYFLVIEEILYFIITFFAGIVIRRLDVTALVVFALCTSSVAFTFIIFHVISVIFAFGTFVVEFINLFATFFIVTLCADTAVSRIRFQRTYGDVQVIFILITGSTGIGVGGKSFATFGMITIGTYMVTRGSLALGRYILRVVITLVGNVTLTFAYTVNRILTYAVTFFTSI